MGRLSQQEANLSSTPALYRPALSSHQKMRSKLKQETPAATSIPPLPRKRKTKKSGQPHEFIAGNWQGR
jgi:hypothetical protein